MQLGSWKTEQQAPQRTNCQTGHGSQKKPKTLGPACVVLISIDIPRSTPLYRHPLEIHGLVRDRQERKQDCCWKGEGAHASPSSQRSLQIMKCWKPPNYTVLLGNMTSRREITDISSIWQNAKILCLIFPISMKTSLWNKGNLFLCLYSYISLIYRSQELSWQQPIVK